MEKGRNNVICVTTQCFIIKLYEVINKNGRVSDASETILV